MIIPYYSMAKLWEIFSQQKSIVCKIKWIDGGHVSSFLFHKSTFVNAIVDSFVLLDKAIKNS